MLAALALLSVPTAATAAAPANVPAALTPAPGTGHGVIGATTPAEEGASLDYAPGLGAGCPGKPGQMTASPLRYGAVFRGNGVVGLPVSMCIGRFPTTAIQVTITPPRGPTITIRDQVIQGSSPGVGFDMLVNPSPPYARYQITDEHGVVARGRVTGDGSGTYTVRARGRFRVDDRDVRARPGPHAPAHQPHEHEPDREARTPAAVRRRGQAAAVDVPGGDLRPLRRRPAMAGFRFARRSSRRADKSGEAIITLDTLSSCPTGDFVALVDPKTALADPHALDPRVAMFTVDKK